MKGSNCFKIFLAILIINSCSNDKAKNDAKTDSIKMDSVRLLVLGAVQDAGSPHIACKKPCCSNLFENPDPSRKVVSLGVYDELTKQTWLFEAGPDIATQIKFLKKVSGSESELPQGIFVSHAHIGHYSGLMYLGREACSAKEMPVFAMPRMCEFIKGNGPWSQLVQLKNISLKSLKNDSFIHLNERIRIKPIQVPHRDEFSETIGFLIEGPNRKILFIPDIDKWEKWERDILKMVNEVDYAFIDATFYSGDEINTRNIAEIPHPFVVETMSLFENQAESVRKKIMFIHMNHTNPMLDSTSDAYKLVKQKGFGIAEFGLNLGL